MGAPTEHGGYYFYSKRLADQDQSVVYRRKGQKGTEEVLLDPNGMSEDKSVTVSLLDISHDGTWMVYGIRHGGEDELEVHIQDTDTKKDVGDVLPRARYFGGVGLKNDKSGLYYGLSGAEGPRVFYHAIGTDAKDDKEIFGKGYDPSKIVAVGLSEEGKWLTLVVYYGSAAAKTEVYVKNVLTDGPLTPVVTDIEAQFEPQIVGDSLYVKTNWNAPNERILRMDLNAPAPADKWAEIVPTGPNVIESFTLVGHKIFVNTLQDVTSRVHIYSPEGKPVGEIKLPTLGTIGSVSGWWEKPEAFFTFASFVTPNTIYRYDAATGRKSVWAKTKVPVDSTKFEVKQIFFPLQRRHENTDVSGVCERPETGRQSPDVSDRLRRLQFE